MISLSRDGKEKKKARRKRGTNEPLSWIWREKRRRSKPPPPGLSKRVAAAAADNARAGRRKITTHHCHRRRAIPAAVPIANDRQLHKKKAE
jgi:hypothetical protein